MNKNIEPQDFERVDRLLQNEIAEALDVFRSKDFEKRLRSRIAAEGKPVRTSPLLLKLAIPAAAALLIAVSAVLLVRDASRLSVPGAVDARDFEAALRRLPAFSGEAPELPSVPVGLSRESGAGRVLAGVLAAAGTPPAEGAKDAPVGAAPGRSRALTMKERMKILFQDKVIERVLARWAYRLKEA